ncbi:hypothetical protein Syun_016505 [Stephania yunnanensis]|uniref:Uncharacterized protein n=1 Tax=Stephania yunnanensis TaxID=152371 RepID=A0AAP0J5C9_9MAGN
MSKQRDRRSLLQAHKGVGVVDGRQATELTVGRQRSRQQADNGINVVAGKEQWTSQRNQQAYRQQVTSAKGQTDSWEACKRADGGFDWRSQRLAGLSSDEAATTAYRWLGVQSRREVRRRRPRSGSAQSSIGEDVQEADLVCSGGGRDGSDVQVAQKWSRERSDEEQRLMYNSGVGSEVTRSSDSREDVDCLQQRQTRSSDGATKSNGGGDKEKNMTKKGVEWMAWLVQGLDVVDAGGQIDHEAFRRVCGDLVVRNPQLGL